MASVFSRLYYGVDEPSKVRRFAINACGASLVLFGYSLLFSDFIPSQNLAEWRSAIAIAGGATLTLIFYWLVATGRYELRASASQVAKALALLMVPFFTAGFVWIGICKGFADVVTLLIGQPYSLSASFNKLHTTSGRWCHYRLYGDSLTESTPPFLCISAETFQTIPNHSIAKVTGKQSFLGFSISAIEFASGANPPLQVDSTPASQLDAHKQAR